jgi:hypothetical protein
MIAENDEPYEYDLVLQIDVVDSALGVALLARQK